MTGLPVCAYGPAVIPAKAGIQEGEAGMVNQPQPHKGIPTGAGTDCLNHWIPACACLQQAGRNDGGGEG